MRYFNPELKDVQSTFVPTELPWEAMLKGLAAKQADFDKTAAVADEAKGAFDLPTSRFVKDEHVKPISEPYKQKYESLVNRFQSGEVNPNQAAREIVNLKHQFEVNPNVQMAKRQAELTKATEAELLKDPNIVNPYFYQGKINPNFKDNPLNVDEGTMSMMFGMNKKGEFDKEHQPFLSGFKDKVMSYTAAQKGYSVDKDPTTGLYVFKDSKGIVVKKGIDATDAKKYINDYATAHFNDSDKQSVVYDKTLGQYTGQSYTPETYANKLYNLAQPMFGIHDIQDNRDDNYSIIPGQTGNGESSNTDRYIPTTVPQEGGDIKVGINANDLYGDGFGMKLLDAMATTAENRAALKSGRGLEVKQIKDLPSNTQAVILNYAKEHRNSKGEHDWGSLADNYQKGVHPPTLAKLYKEMETSGYLDKMNEQLIKSQNSVETFREDDPRWVAITGSKGENRASVVLNKLNLSNQPWLDPISGEEMSTKDKKTILENATKDESVDVGQYLPENNLAKFSTKNVGLRPLLVNYKGQKFVVPAPFEDSQSKTHDVMVNRLFNMPIDVLNDPKLLKEGIKIYDPISQKDLNFKYNPITKTYTGNWNYINGKAQEYNTPSEMIRDYDNWTFTNPKAKIKK